MGTSLRRALQQIKPHNQRVWFETGNTVTQFHTRDVAAMITFDSGADGHYISEADRKRAKLPILRPSTKRVGVANGGVSAGKYLSLIHI